MMARIISSLMGWGERSAIEDHAGWKKGGLWPGWLVILAMFMFASCAQFSSYQPSTSEPISTNTPPVAATLSNVDTPAVDLPPPDSILTLDPVDPDLYAYPGPAHYEGDLLTFELDVNRRVDPGEGPVTLSLDNQEPFQVTGNWSHHYLRFPFDTTGWGVGERMLSIRAEHDGVRVEETYSLEIQPARQRPEQEQNPAWVSREEDCCILHYITGTAAARDIEQISSTVQDAAEDFNAYPTVEVSEKIHIYFIDRMWFNGAFAGGDELLIAYTDRFYGPSRGQEGLEVLVRHEMGHAVFPSFTYGEGLSVYLAGGHYMPEPIPRRAAAMLELGFFDPDNGPLDQHEIVYLYQAAVIHYFIDAYGWEALRDFVQVDQEESSGRAFREAVDITKEDFEEEFLTWLRGQDPGQEVQDLELTVELQNLRREYQENYAPFPWFLLASAETFTRPEYVRVNIREPRTSAHIATELLIANAQQALAEDQYQQARELIRVLDRVVNEGRLDEPLAREYGNVVLALAQEGYEVVSLDLRKNKAHVQAVKTPPALVSLSLHKVDGRWMIDGSQ